MLLLTHYGAKMKKILIVAVIGFQMLVVGCATTNNWPHQKSVGLVEYYWHQRQLLPSKEEAIGTIKNLSPYFVESSGAWQIAAIDIDNYGMRASGTWSETNSQWVPSWGGLFIGSTYVPTYGGSVQTSANTRQGSFSMPFKDIKWVWLVRFPTISASYKWGVLVSYLGQTPPVTLRVRSEGEARALISAIETIAADHGYDFSNPGFDIRELTYEQSSEVGLSGGAGGYCAIIFQDGPFDKAGLRSGDIILTIDGKEQRGMIGLKNMWGGTKEWVISRRDSPRGPFKKIALHINADETIKPMLMLNGYLQ